MVAVITIIIIITIISLVTIVVNLQVLQKAPSFPTTSAPLPVLLISLTFPLLPFPPTVWSPSPAAAAGGREGGKRALQ